MKKLDYRWVWLGWSGFARVFGYLKGDWTDLGNKV